jgi:protein-L-isoaspartate(D-aspartate) O-methyltransferase
VTDQPTLNAQTLVEALKAKGLLNDPLIEAAFLAVPRHYFLPELPPDEIYIDRAVPIKREPNGVVVSSSSQPSMMALMLRQLELDRGLNVLEIGTGTGYNAAIMQHIVGPKGRVTTVEIDADVARRARDHLQRALAGSVTVVDDDGAGGYAPRAMYDRIICTAAVWDLPLNWARQLKPGGIIVTPIQLAGAQVCAAFRLEPDGTLYSRDNLPCWFVEMRGVSAGDSLWRRVGSAGLTVSSVNIDRVDPAALALLLSDDHDIVRLSISPENEQRSGEMRLWFDFVPYAILNMPPKTILALYSIPAKQQAYGIPGGDGFALLTPGSACFVPYRGVGEAHCFAGVDAFIALEKLMADWASAGRPGVGQLRLRLYPKASAPSQVSVGLLGQRPSFVLHAWLDLPAA